MIEAWKINHMGASYQSSSNPLHPCSLVPTPQPIKHLLHLHLSWQKSAPGGPRS